MAKEIIIREFDQQQVVIDSLVEKFQFDDDLVDPIVLIEDAETLTILDGHHRYLASQAADVPFRFATISRESYETAVAAGYDDIEIAAAVHCLHKNWQAFDNINAQFGGVVAYRADAAAAVIEED